MSTPEDPKQNDPWRDPRHAKPDDSPTPPDRVTGPNSWQEPDQERPWSAPASSGAPWHGTAPEPPPSASDWAFPQPTLQQESQGGHYPGQPPGPYAEPQPGHHQDAQVYPQPSPPSPESRPGYQPIFPTDPPIPPRQQPTFAPHEQPGQPSTAGDAASPSNGMHWANGVNDRPATDPKDPYDWRQPHEPDREDLYADFGTQSQPLPGWPTSPHGEWGYPASAGEITAPYGRSVGDPYGTHVGEATQTFAANTPDHARPAFKIPGEEPAPPPPGPPGQPYAAPGRPEGPFGRPEATPAQPEPGPQAAQPGPYGGTYGQEYPRTEGPEAFSGYPGQPVYPPPPGGTPYPPGGGQPPGTRGGLGTAALVLGIVSLVLLFFCGLGLVTAIVGIIIGIVAVNKSSNRTRAIIGIVLSVVTLVLGAIFSAILFSWIRNKGIDECFDRTLHPTQESTQRCLERKFEQP
ncbi:DUF4190 domain-containing protein [Acrocarpospora catenulata]|uniref:DUF4190 domain-containing protein n=1 Tax=Acrocarpospora catenulata TaxID=2836182 RepID=UPI001BDAC2A8|nr:DUF4190 domain-containing protein [Acrocarpospora catenulata]